MVIPQPDGKDLVFISGYIFISFKGGVKAPQINRDNVTFVVGSDRTWDSVDNVVPSVTLASIFNDGPADYAGWAVDDTTWNTTTPGELGKQLLLKSNLALRDSDGFIRRLSYHVTALGKLAS